MRVVIPSKTGIAAPLFSHGGATFPAPIHRRPCYRLQPAAALTFFTSQYNDANNEDTNSSSYVPSTPQLHKPIEKFESSSSEVRNDIWDRTLLLRRQLTLATDGQDFHLATRIKSELFATVSKLSTKYAKLYLSIETIMDPTAGLAAKTSALYELRMHGNTSTLPVVCSVLYSGDSKLRREAEEAAAAIRHRSVAPDVVELCRTGALHLITLLSGGDDEEEIEKIGAEAVAVYSAALEKDGLCATARAGRGAALYCLKKYEAAGEDLDAAVQLDPWNMNAARMLALTRGQLKQFSLAYAALNAAVALNPSLSQDKQHIVTKKVIQNWEEEAREWKQKYLRLRNERAAEDERRAKLEKLLAQTPTMTEYFFF